MLSGGRAGLVTGEILRKEQEENRRKEKHNQPLEGWFCSLYHSTHFNFVTTYDNFHRQIVIQSLLSYWFKLIFL